MSDEKPLVLQGWPTPEKAAPDTSRDRFRQNLARIMADRRITQAGLARTMDVSRVAVHAWIWGTCFPETSRLLKLAQALGVQVGTLLEGDSTDSFSTPSEPTGQSEEAMLLEAFRKLPNNARLSLLADVHQKSMQFTPVPQMVKPGADA